MTDDILAKAKALEEDRKAIGEDIEKFKNTYAKYIISDGDKICGDKERREKEEDAEFFQ